MTTTVEITGTVDDSLRSLLQAEYQCLRDEMAKRIEMRQRIVDLTIVSAGAILALDAKTNDFDRILIVYPLLVMFLAAAWTHHGLFLLKLATYLREVVEPVLASGSNVTIRVRDGGPGVEIRKVGYETDVSRFSSGFQRRIGTLSTAGLFLAVQILSIVLGRSRNDDGSDNTILEIISWLAILLTMWILTREKLRKRFTLASASSESKGE